MTFTALPAIAAPRRRVRPTWLGALITAAFVAGGTVAATAALPTVQTPAQVAKAYLEARYAADWSKAWAMECSMTHSFVGSSTRFARDAASWDEELSLPRDVVVAVGDELHHDEALDGIITVTATVTSAERSDWKVTGELPLLVQDGKIQVCDGGLSLKQTGDA